MRSIIRLYTIALGILVGATLGPIIPVIAPAIGVAQADWVRYELVAPTMVNGKLKPAGTQVCKDEATGVLADPFYTGKSDVTKICTAYTPFTPWLLGSAEAAPIRLSPLPSPNGHVNTGCPLGDCAPAPATLSWNDACVTAALAPIASQQTGTATDIDLSSCKSGSSAASATCALHTAVTNWAMDSMTCHLTNAGSVAGSSATLGPITIDLTASSLSDSTSPFSWLYQDPVVSDTLAPPIPTDLRTVAGTDQVVISGDTPWDACGDEECSGAQYVDLQADGSDLTTISVSPGFSCSPTATNIGAMSGTHSATQSGNDWTLVSPGTMDGTAASYEYVNCASNGAGYAVVQVNSITGAAGFYRKGVLSRRASQTVQGSVEINVGAMLADDDNQYFYVDARLATDALRQHIVPAIAVTLPFCMKLEWDASNNHTVSTATAPGAGECNNDWTTRLSAYNLAFPTTSYIGIGASANSGGAGSATTIDFRQLNINNVARWSYTHSTSTSHSYTARARDLAPTPNASSYSTSVTGAPSSGGGGGGGAGNIKFEPGVYAAFNKQCIPWDGVRYGCTAEEILNTISTEICPNSYLQGMKLLGLPSFFVNKDTLGSYTNPGGADIGFTVVDQVLDALDACGKFLIIQSIGNVQVNLPNQHYQFFPCYTFEASWGTCGTAAPGTYGFVERTQTSQPDGQIARAWNTDWRDLAVTWAAAYCNRYETGGAHASPAFYAIGMLYWNVSLPLSTNPPGYNESTFNDQFRSYVASARTACPTTNILATLDYANPHPSQMSTWLASLQTSKGSMANTDTWIIYGSTWGQSVYAGEVGSPSAIDYRGVVRNFEEVETPDMCQSQTATPADFYDEWRTGTTNPLARPRRPNHIVIFMAGECDPTYGWQAWKDYLDSLGGYTIMNGSDSTLRTPADVKANYCESSMTCD